MTAIAVLSRADEIGGAHVDALDAARRAAQRYADDPRLSTRCSAIVPVAALLAETAATLREDEARAIAALADLPSPDVEQLLLSTDRFIDPNRADLPAEQRTALLERLGLFGVRWSIDAYRSRRIQSAADLARGLHDVSGITELTTRIDSHLARRAESLKARSALSALLSVAQTTAAEPTVARRIIAAVEEVETTAPEFQDLRLWHLISTGTSALTADQVSEVERITASRPSAERLNLPHDAPAGEIAQAALSGAQRWRRRAGNPFATRTDVEAYESIARIYERLHHEQQ